MNPWKLKKITLECAKWLNKADKTIWLTPAVLTHYNADPSSPKYSTEEALEVFKQLHDRDLLTATSGEVTLPGNNKMKMIVYLFNQAKISEWKTFIEDDGFWSMYVSPLFDRLFGIKSKINIFFVSVIVIIFTQLIQSFTSDVYDYIKSILIK